MYSEKQSEEAQQRHPRCMGTILPSLTAVLVVCDPVCKRSHCSTFHTLFLTTYSCHVPPTAGLQVDGKHTGTGAITLSGGYVALAHYLSAQEPRSVN